MPPRLPKGAVPRKRPGMLSPVTVLILSSFVARAAYVWFNRDSISVIKAKPSGIFIHNVTCLTPLIYHNGNCARVVVDDVFSQDDVLALRSLAEKGMSVRPSIGGPTILDLNTGYLRDTAGLVNLFNDDTYAGLIDQADFDLYGRMIEKLKLQVEETFGLPKDYIFFTAPTFITRLDGRDSWNPKGVLLRTFSAVLVHHLM